MSNLEEVCRSFNLAIEILEATYETYVPEKVYVLVKDAIKVLDSTYKPLLKAYNVDKSLCKERYCYARDTRDTAITYLDLAVEVLEFYGDDIEPCDFGDVDYYIKEAVNWIKISKKSAKCH